MPAELCTSSTLFGLYGVSIGLRYISQAILKSATDKRKFSTMTEIINRNHKDIVNLKIIAPIAIGVLAIAAGLISSLVYNNSQAGLFFTSFGALHAAEAFAFNYYQKHRKPK